MWESWGAFNTSIIYNVVSGPGSSPELRLNYLHISHMCLWLAAHLSSGKLDGDLYPMVLLHKSSLILENAIVSLVSDATTSVLFS